MSHGRQLKEPLRNPKNFQKARTEVLVLGRKRCDKDALLMGPFTSTVDEAYKSKSLCVLEGISSSHGQPSPRQHKHTDGVWSPLYHVPVEVKEKTRAFEQSRQASENPVEVAGT